MQERVTTLAEVPAWVDFVFLDEPTIDEAGVAKAMKDSPATAFLDDAIAAYADVRVDRDGAPRR